MRAPTQLGKVIIVGVAVIAIGISGYLIIKSKFAGNIRASAPSEALFCFEKGDATCIAKFQHPDEAAATGLNKEAVQWLYSTIIVPFWNSNEKLGEHLSQDLSVEQFAEQGYRLSNGAKYRRVAILTGKGKQGLVSDDLRTTLIAMYVAKNGSTQISDSITLGELEGLRKYQGELQAHGIKALATVDPVTSTLQTRSIEEEIVALSHKPQGLRSRPGFAPATFVRPTPPKR